MIVPLFTKIDRMLSVDTFFVFVSS